MKHRILFFILVVVLISLPMAAAARNVYPEVIPLENGFAPEGITEGTGNNFYYGALNGGAIFRRIIALENLNHLSAPIRTELLWACLSTGAPVCYGSVAKNYAVR